MMEVGSTLAASIKTALEQRINPALKVIDVTETPGGIELTGRVYSHRVRTEACELASEVCSDRIPIVNNIKVVRNK